jgi:hypothetical protein
MAKRVSSKVITVGNSKAVTLPDWVLNRIADDTVGDGGVENVRFVEANFPNGAGKTVALLGYAGAEDEGPPTLELTDQGNSNGGD